MAEYTMELKDVIACGHEIFDFKYPFYDDSKRIDFERKFIQHFYFREICHPAVERFKFYLRDKFATVLPYYNELFKAAQIEYSVLDNYSLTEEFTSTRENEGKTSGISSTRGQIIGNQVTDSNTNVDTNGTETDKDKTVTDVNATGSSTTDANASTNKDSVKKFLDTPQGLTNLEDSNYLTTLHQDADKDSATNHSKTDTTDGSKTVSDRNDERKTENHQATTGKSTVSDDQKTSQDNNTRTYTDGKQTETHKLVRKGNIGVDTDSDMIEKHIRLQKTLTRIELMFFDECEDLFMLVY